MGKHSGGECRYLVRDITSTSARFEDGVQGRDCGGFAVNTRHDVAMFRAPPVPTPTSILAGQVRGLLLITIGIGV